jgi:hypothetical protein
MSQKKLNLIIKSLKQGSNVVVVSSNNLLKNEDIKIPSKVNTYHYKKNDINIINDIILRQHSKLLNRPKIHLQLDVIIVDADTDKDLVKQLIEYIHPNGYLITSNANELNFEQIENLNVWFAKFTQGDKNNFYNVIKKLPENSIYVEIGSYKGGSAVLAASINPFIKIYCVDIWLDSREILSSPFSSFERHIQFFDNITPIHVNLDKLEEGLNKIAIHEGIPVDDLKINCLFIDGDHSYNGVMQDLNTYAQNSDLIFGHDCYKGGDVERAVYTYFSKSSKLNILVNSLRKITIFKIILKLLSVFPVYDSLLKPSSVKTHKYKGKLKSSIFIKE